MELLRKVFLPSNIDIEKRLYGLDTKEKESAILMLSYMFNSTYMGYHGDIKRAKNVCVNTSISKFLYSTAIFNKLVIFLQRRGLIKFEHDSKKWVISKRYSLSKDFNNITDLTEYEITDKELNNRLVRLRFSFLKNAIENNKTIIHEVKMLSYARIDLESAEKYIKENYDEKSNEYLRRLLCINEYNKLKYIRELNNGDLYLPVSIKYVKGRLYSPATALPRDLEQFTYFSDCGAKGVQENGRDTVTLDMPNSQICFFNEYARRNSYNKRIVISKRLLNIFRSKIKDLHFENAKYNRELTEWERIVFDGKAYETMMYLSKWKGKEFGWTSEERQEFKPYFFKNVLFNKLRKKKTHLEEVFHRYFPIDANLLLESKRKLSKVGFFDFFGIRVKENSALAIEVQNLEGYLFHNVISRYMLENYSHIPYVIKHDSIKIPKKYSYINSSINNIVKDFFGIATISLKQTA